ncbi:MAG: TetR family transcriptional regulator [Bacteroidia bacterium]
MSRKQEIQVEALLMMKEVGFAGMTMRGLARKLGIEAPSLYNHLKSKDELLIEVCSNIALQLETQILEVNDIYFNAIDKLKMAIQGHVNVLTKNIIASYVFVNEWRFLPSNEKEIFIQRRDQYEYEFRRILELGINEGNLQFQDVKITSLTLLSALNSIVDWFHPDGDLSSEEVAKQLFQFVGSGIKNETEIHW